MRRGFVCAARLSVRLGSRCNLQSLILCGVWRVKACKALYCATLHYGAAHKIGGAAREIGTNSLKNRVFGHCLPCLRHGLAVFYVSRIIRA